MRNYNETMLKRTTDQLVDITSIVVKINNFLMIYPFEVIMQLLSTEYNGLHIRYCENEERIPTLFILLISDGKEYF